MTPIQPRALTRQVAVFARLAWIATGFQLLGEVEVRPVPGLHLGSMLGSRIEVWAPEAIDAVDTPHA